MTDFNSSSDIGQSMWCLVRDLFPLCRSLTGDGVTETLRQINTYVGGTMKSFQVPTGTKCFDWVVPKEWNIKDAYIRRPDGSKICQLKDSNLHVVGYSQPLQKKVSLSELQKNLHSLPETPDVIPYVTSYYNETWGFCLSHNQRLELVDGVYEVVIDSELKDGHLTYGEVVIPGLSEKEIFL